MDEARGDMARQVETPWKNTAVDKLIHADWNYKVDDDDMTTKLVANIKRNGQVESILVRNMPDGVFEVVNGNHRLVAFQQLGIKEVMCFHLGDIDLKAAQRLAIEVNETGFDASYPALAKLVRDIAGGDDFTDDSLADLAETLPFHHDQLNHFVNLADVNWEQQYGEPEGDGTSLRKAPPVKLTEEQRVIFNRACAKIREDDRDISEGRCLELICADFLAGV